MTVADLIDRLSRMDPSLEVRVEYTVDIGPIQSEHEAEIRELRVERPATARRYVIIEVEGGE